LSEQLAKNALESSAPNVTPAQYFELVRARELMADLLFKSSMLEDYYTHFARAIAAESPRLESFGVV